VDCEKISRLFLAVSQDGTLLSETDQIEQITQEIEQHDHLMEANYKSEQLRIDTIKSMPQSLAAKRLIRARLLRSISRRSHLSSNSTSALRNCKFFPVIFLKKARSWYRQAFNSCDIWYGSMKEIEGRFGSKIGVYFKILRFLVMLNFFVAIFTFRWAGHTKAQFQYRFLMT
jgi:transmembrane channel-like protein